MSLLDKSPSFWLAVIGASIYVYRSQPEEGAFLGKLIRVVGAVAMTVPTHEEVALMIGAGENITLILMIPLIWVILDASAAIIKDHKAFMAIVMKKVGK